jgi:hypothetical protein
MLKTEYSMHTTRRCVHVMVGVMHPMLRCVHGTGHVMHETAHVVHYTGHVMHYMERVVHYTEHVMHAAARAMHPLERLTRPRLRGEGAPNAAIARVKRVCCPVDARSVSPLVGCSVNGMRHR